MISLQGQHHARGRGKGKGKAFPHMSQNGQKRRRFILRDNVLGITKPACRRIARRGGVKRISGGVYENVREYMKETLTLIIKNAQILTQCSKMKTINDKSIYHALRIQGISYYG